MSTTTAIDFRLVRPRQFGQAQFEIRGFDRRRIDAALPARLTPYLKKARTLTNFVKRTILFSRPGVAILRTFFCARRTVLHQGEAAGFYEMIRPHTAARPNKYNFVLTGERMIAGKIRPWSDPVNWMLGKHILLSGYSPDVRFAGEFWKTPDGALHFNTNSGTYAPADETLPAVERVMSKLFPGARIVAEKRGAT